MKHTKIINVVEKRYEKINFAFDKVIHHFGTEDIHIFRMEVKKLSSFLRLADTVDGERRLTLPKKLHKFYKAVGFIRSLQIQKQYVQALLQDGHSLVPKTYLNFITFKINGKIDLAKKLIKGESPFKKGEHKLLDIMPINIRQKIQKEFISNRLKTLEKLMKLYPSSDNSLHSIRKILKDLLYTWPFIKKNTYDIIPSEIFSSKEDISSITELLGNFQDRCVCLYLLNAYFQKQESNESERILLHNLETEWRKENRITRLKIINSFHKIILSNQTINSN